MARAAGPRTKDLGKASLLVLDNTHPQSSEILSVTLPIPGHLLHLPEAQSRLPPGGSSLNGPSIFCAHSHLSPCEEYSSCGCWVSLGNILAQAWCRVGGSMGQPRGKEDTWAIPRQVQQMPLWTAAHNMQVSASAVTGQVPAGLHLRGSLDLTPPA